MRPQAHLRNTFLAGIFAAIPIAVTAFVIYYVDGQTRTLFHVHTPLLGIILAIASLYLLGLIVSSIIGRFVLRGLDGLLRRLPVLRSAYEAWKQISLTPAGGQGMYSHVVLVSLSGGPARVIAFTSLQPLASDPETICVFVPGLPNPLTGRLYFVPIANVVTIPISTDEAFKLLLSGGNYIPPEIGRATLASRGATAESLPASQS